MTTDSAHNRALFSVMPPLRLADSDLEDNIRAYITALLDDAEVKAAIAEQQANGWDYGTHPTKKAQIAIDTLKRIAGE